MSLEYPCVYYADGKCKKYGGDGVVSYCVLGPCSDERKSNADRIRNMTDEELANWIINIDTDHPCPPDGSCACMNNNCMNGWLDWLKQEAETE